MPVQHRSRQVNDISNEDAVDSWDKAAEEFTSFFAEGGDFYHQHIINPAMMDLLGEIDSNSHFEGWFPGL